MFAVGDLVRICKGGNLFYLEDPTSLMHMNTHRVEKGDIGLVLFESDEFNPQFLFVYANSKSGWLVDIEVEKL